MMAGKVTGAALAEIRGVFDGPLTAYPDSGHMKLPEWQFEEVISPDALAAFADHLSSRRRTSNSRIGPSGIVSRPTRRAAAW